MLKKSSLFVLAFFLSVAGLRADNIVDQIVARVDNSIITRSDFEKGKQTAIEDLKQRYPGDWQAKWTEREKDVLRDLIDQQLLLAKGKDLGITGDTEVIKRLNEIRQQMNLGSMEELEKAAAQQGVSYEDFKEQVRAGIVTQQVIGREVGSRIHITNEELQAFYQEHLKELESPEMVKLSEILISTQPRRPVDSKDKNSTAQAAPLPEDPAQVAEAQAKANQIVEELRKGAKFEEVAKKESNGSTAAQGGEIGSFKRGEMARELEEKTFPLKSGEISDVVRTRQGFIIFKVVEHIQAGVPPLKDVEEKIREALYVKKLEPALRAYLTKLREEAYVDVRQGFTDTGASPNQNKPVVMAANRGSDEIRPAAKNKKKKHFVLF